MDAVIDTSVLMDIPIADRPRHANAVLLANELADRNIKCIIPMHSMFELTSAIRTEFESKGKPVKLQAITDS